MSVSSAVNGTTDFDIFYSRKISQMFTEKSAVQECSVLMGCNMKGNGSSVLEELDFTNIY